MFGLLTNSYQLCVHRGTIPLLHCIYRRGLRFSGWNLLCDHPLFSPTRSNIKCIYLKNMPWWKFWRHHTYSCLQGFTSLYVFTFHACFALRVIFSRWYSVHQKPAKIKIGHRFKFGVMTCWVTSLRKESIAHKQERSMYYSSEMLITPLKKQQSN